MFNRQFKPDQNIEITFLLEKVIRQISHIKITLFLDLQVYSLTETPYCVESFQQELGSETIEREDIKRNSDGQNFQALFSLAKI